MRILLEFLVAAEYGPPAGRIPQENAGQAAGYFPGHLRNGQVLARTGGAFNLKIVAVVVVEALQRFDEQVIDREPDRAAPVGVAAEQAGIRFSRLVGDPEAIAIGV